MEEQRKNGIPISSLEEFIKAINENCIDKRRLFLESMDDVWFRGESKIHPKVIPSLFRDDFNENIPKGISVTKESDLIEMAFQSFPEVFSKCNNAIERLVTMQHYTLPTRLLDITKNPLVALFFACNNYIDKEDGFVLYVAPTFYDEATLNIVATLAEDAECNEVSVETICKKLFQKGLIEKDPNIKDVFYNLVVAEIVTKPLAYLPKYNNQRIKNQRGAVICAPLFTFKDNEEEQKTALLEHKSMNFYFHKKATDISSFFENKRFVIAANKKSRILQELDVYGINEATVYPEVEHQMQYIKFHCSHKNNEILKLLDKYSRL